MDRTLLRTGCLLALLSVVFGAFGAHSLKQLFGEQVIQIYETGVRYQFYHSIAIIISGILFQNFPNNRIKYSGYFFLVGILLFSGSLYALTFIKGKDIIGLNGIGILTPIGGLLFIIGWLFMILGIRINK